MTSCDVARVIQTTTLVLEPNYIIPSGEHTWCICPSAPAPSADTLNQVKREQARLDHMGAAGWKAVAKVGPDKYCSPRYPPHVNV
jgi:hypothetical protein